MAQSVLVLITKAPYGYEEGFAGAQACAFPTGGRHDIQMQHPSDRGRYAECRRWSKAGGANDAIQRGLTGRPDGLRGQGLLREGGPAGSGSGTSRCWRASPRSTGKRPGRSSPTTIWSPPSETSSLFSPFPRHSKRFIRGPHQSVMLEVLGRSGVGRSARWTASSFKTLTPNVSSPGTRRYRCPVGTTSSHRQWGMPTVSMPPGPDNGDILVPQGFYPPLSQMRGGRTDFGSIEGTGVTVVRGDPGAIAEQVKASTFRDRRPGQRVRVSTGRPAVRRGHGGAAGRRGAQTPGLCAGMMDVSNLALLTYMGVDLFDTSLLQYRSSRMEVSMAEGAISARDSKWVGATTPTEAFALSLENAARELQLVRHMIGQATTAGAGRDAHPCIALAGLRAAHIR